jgi:hypothetical protein
MPNNLENRLIQLSNAAMTIHTENIPDAEGQASTVAKFADDTTLRATYWRLIRNGIAELSSFDHKQKYGLQAPINAPEKLSNPLSEEICLSVRFDKETADIVLTFAPATKLQIFSLTGYEDWHIQFPDNTAEYSNFALASSHALN